jgi:MraZ protein
MLLGEYEYTVDDRGRLAIPARLRDAFHAGLVLARGLDQFIAVYPNEQWENVTAQMSGLPPNSIDVRRWRRNIFPSAFQAELDRQGRVLLPQSLREYAGIETRVVIAGVLDMLEIWDQEAWRVEQALLREQGARIAESVSLPVMGASRGP